MADGTAKDAETARMKQIDDVGTNVIVCGTASSFLSPFSLRMCHHIVIVLSYQVH